MGRKRLEGPGYVWLSRVQTFHAAVQVHIQVHYFPLLFGRLPGLTGLTPTGLRPGLATTAPGLPPGRPTTAAGLPPGRPTTATGLGRWGTGLPTERLRRVPKRAKRRSSLMF